MCSLPLSLRSLLALSLLVGVACKKRESESTPAPARKSIPAAATPAPQLELAPASPAFAEVATLPFAIYHLPTPKHDTLAELKKLVTNEYSFLTIAEDMESGTMPFVVAQEPDMADFAPPDAESLAYFASHQVRLSTCRLPEVARKLRARQGKTSMPVSILPPDAGPGAAPDLNEDSTEGQTSSHTSIADLGTSRRWSRLLNGDRE